MAASGADPSRVHTRADLARELTLLRSAAGLTVRDLARRVDTPFTTVGGYFGGRHLPGLRQIPLYRALVAACGVTDPAEADRWVEALMRARAASDGRAARSLTPYKGLEPFGEADADLFFGRQETLDDLLARMRALAGEPEGAIVPLVGPSGSGKSSLLSAGLLSAVNSGALDQADVSWSARAVAVDRLAGVDGPVDPPREGPDRAVVVVDQFEEALILPADRRAAVMAAVAALAGRDLVVVAIRADFYQAAAAEPGLLAALQRNQVLIGPMTAAELRSAVVGPAHQVGATVDEGLVDLILSDLGSGREGGVAHEPGALPLLSYALLRTWERAGRNQITIADYRAVGGLRGAVLQAAEELYGSFDRGEQELVRRLFARLIRVEPGSPPTRRRATREELLQTGDDERDRQMSGVLERFVAARLLTTGAGTIEVSHEALISSWPRLAEWVEGDSEWLQFHQQLRDAALAWEANGRDESMLWTGARLETAAAHTETAGRELNRLEGEFVGRALDRRHAVRAAERRRARRTQRLLAAVAVLAVGASVLSAVTIASRRDAVRARDEALSRQVAIESQQIQGSDPALAAQLAVAAYRIYPTVQARSTLVDTTAAEVPYRLLGPPGPLFVAVSGDGRTLAVAQSADDTVALYRLGAGAATRLARLTAGPAGAQDFAVAVSPDGRLLAAGGTGGGVTLWALRGNATPARDATITGLGATVYSLAFSPDGAHLAAAGSDGTLRQWSVTDPHSPTPDGVWHAPGGAALKGVAYTAGGRSMVAAGANGVIGVWTTGDSRAALTAVTGSPTFETVSVSPGTGTVAAGASDDRVYPFRLAAAGRLVPARGPVAAGTSQVDSTAFTADGANLAAGSADGSVHLFDTRTWAPAGSLSHPSPVTGLAYTPDRRTLVSADSTGETRLWPLPLQSSLSEPGSVYSLAYSPGGRRLYAFSGGDAGDATEWNTASDPLRPSRRAEITLPAPLGPVAGTGALDPSGGLLATADTDARIELLGVGGSAVHPEGPTLTGAQPYVESLAFSPDGRILASGDDAGQVLLWDVGHPATPRRLAHVTLTKGEVLGVAFSPDGRLLAAADTDGKVVLYRVTDPSRPVSVATLGGFSNYAYTVAFTPDSRTLVAGSADGTIRMWDVADPAAPARVGPVLSVSNGYVFDLALSPDGRTLAAATTDHAVWLWDIGRVEHPQLLDTLSAAQDAVFSVAFPPAGGVLAAGGSDRQLHLWSYQPAAALNLVCREAGAPVTRAEWAQYVQGLGYRSPCG